jgi:hypothetical protein
VSVVPRTAPDEVLSTVLHASRALMGVAVGANELLGITTESHKLAAVVTEFEQKQHGTHKESLLDRLAISFAFQLPICLRMERISSDIRLAILLVEILESMWRVLGRNIAASLIVHYRFVS